MHNSICLVLRSPFGERTIFHGIVLRTSWRIKKYVYGAHHVPIGANGIFIRSDALKSPNSCSFVGFDLLHFFHDHVPANIVGINFGFLRNLRNINSEHASCQLFCNTIPNSMDQHSSSYLNVLEY